MRILNISLVIFCIVILISCADYKNSEGFKDKDTIEAYLPADDNEIIIVPEDATAQSVIFLKTIMDGEIIWYINGVRDESAKGARFSSPALQKGDVVQAVIIKDGKKYYSNEIIIKNTPPRIVKAKLSPQIPRVNSIIYVEIEAYDVDNDNIDFKYRWYLNGKFVSDRDILDIEKKRGDIITVEITPYDNEIEGKIVKLETRVFNSVPVVSESTPLFEDNIYRYQVVATDPDGDTLTYKLQDAPRGMSIDPTKGIVTWKVDSSYKGEIEYKILISDNHGGEVLIPVTVEISSSLSTS